MRSRTGLVSVCSFCRRYTAAVGKLIAGPKVSICVECVGRGLQLVLTQVVARSSPAETMKCGFCEKGVPSVHAFRDNDGVVCVECLKIAIDASLGTAVPTVASPQRSRPIKLAHELLKNHFEVEAEQLITSASTFPVTARADIQVVLERFAEPERGLVKVVGVQASEHRFAALDFGDLMKGGSYPATIAPLAFEDIDVGEPVPMRCVQAGLWLFREAAAPYALLVSPARTYGEVSGVRVEIAALRGDNGEVLIRRTLEEIQSAIQKAQTYRGKIISFEIHDHFRGTASGVAVHRLKTVTREDVILPSATIGLLDRCIFDFLKHRERLAALRMAAKRGLLFYGPPGTGKTHTLHYLGAKLKDHTTLIMGAEQVALIQQYIATARLLQPSILVIEDADLIGRSRENMNGPCEEVLLNRLLNEMDGLREDAQILFILTTNRPEALEPALRSRPGRIDQAIEFPLPDADGRRKLASLYAGSLQLQVDVLESIVARTEGVSAAFIKELMRRAAQSYLDRGAAGGLERTDLDRGLEDMLFTGGSLNAALLGIEVRR